MHYVILFFCVLLLSLGLTHLSILFAHSHNINDHPDEFRKFHANPTPSTGGLAIGIAFLIGLLLNNMVHPSSHNEIFNFLWYFFTGSIVIFATGIYDDIIGLSSLPKFSFQILATIIVLIGFYNEIFPRFADIEYINVWVLVAVFFLFGFWVVANTNIMNLIDGVDGLASTVALTEIFGLIIISISWQSELINTFTIPLAAAIIGFLVFNKPPAYVFMGDTGSLLIGFAIAIISLLTCLYAPHWHYSFALVVLPAVAGVDTLFSLIRRLKKGVNPFESDHSHIHHILQKYFKSPALTDIILGSVSLIFVMIAILLANLSDDILYFSVLGILIVLVISLSVIYYLKMDSINAIVEDESETKRVLKKVTNGRRDYIGSDKSIDTYVNTYKN